MHICIRIESIQLFLLDPYLKNPLNIRENFKSLGFRGKQANPGILTEPYDQERKELQYILWTTHPRTIVNLFWVSF